MNYSEIPVNEVLSLTAVDIAFILVCFVFTIGMFFFLYWLADQLMPEDEPLTPEQAAAIERERVALEKY